jgi:predicted GIY-YIG superfamily endonuclease
MTKQYYIYMLANVSRRIYVGMTNDLERRIYEHKHKLLSNHDDDHRKRSVILTAGKNLNAGYNEFIMQPRCDASLRSA